MIPIMSDGVFIADSRLFFSQELAALLRDRGVNVFLTGNKSDEEESIKCRYDIEWDRSSLFSLQSLPLQLKNLQSQIEQAVLPFDSMAYLNLYPTTTSILNIDVVVSELISANIALISILKDYFEKQGTGRLIFVYRSATIPTENAPVMAASGAFIKMAEETVASILQDGKTGIQTLLVKLEERGEEGATEWLANQMKLSSFAKMQGKWIKAGQKSLFGKY